MKKVLFALSALALLCAFVACSPENNNGEGGGNQDNPDEIAVTGEALDVTAFSAMLTGYANLPSESAGDVEAGIMYGKGKSFEEARMIAASGLDGDNSFTVKVTGLSPGTTYSYKSYVQSGTAIKYGAVKSFTTKESKCPEGAVDLGIVMTRADGTTYDLYWAKSNLREGGFCANPEDYGDYYAWGETDPYYEAGHSRDNPCGNWRNGKTGYDYASYKWCNGSNSTMTKYCTMGSYGNVDDITVLQRGEKSGETMDDVARYELGVKWRMPTLEEWIALMDQCTWVRTTQNGIPGTQVSAANGNSIFLPATGCRYDVELTHPERGFYWSSSLGTDLPNLARAMSFKPDRVLTCYESRAAGLSIRPVTE